MSDIATWDVETWVHAVKDIREVMAKHFPGMEWNIHGAGIPGEGPYWRLEKSYAHIGPGWQLGFKLDEGEFALMDKDYRVLDEEEADARMREVSERVLELGAGERY